MTGWGLLQEQHQLWTPCAGVYHTVMHKAKTPAVCDETSQPVVAVTRGHAAHAQCHGSTTASNNSSAQQQVRLTTCNSRSSAGMRNASLFCIMYQCLMDPCACGPCPHRNTLSAGGLTWAYRKSQPENPSADKLDVLLLHGIASSSYSYRCGSPMPAGQPRCSHRTPSAGWLDAAQRNSSRRLPTGQLAQ